MATFNIDNDTRSNNVSPQNQICRFFRKFARINPMRLLKFGLKRTNEQMSKWTICPFVEKKTTNGQVVGLVQTLPCDR